MKDGAMRQLLSAVCQLELALANIRTLHLPRGSVSWCSVCQKVFPCPTYNLAIGESLSVEAEG